MTTLSGRTRANVKKWGVKTSVLVTCLFCAMFLDAIAVPGLGIPVSSVAAIMAVLYAFIAPQRLPKLELHTLPGWFVVLVLAVPSWMAFTSVVNGAPDIRRLVNIGVFSALIIVLTGSRLNLSSVGRGLALAVVAGVAVGIALLPTSSYVGRMTGPLGDPNSAGYLIVVYTALALPSVKLRKYQLSLVALATAGVVLTDSRTSMLAMGIMTLWVALSRFLSSWLSVPIVASVLLWIISASETLASDAFPERAGSDALRERIYAVELADVAVNPIIGQGAGAAKVAIDGTTFFFHSSYLAIRAEAGWVGFIISLALLAAVFFSLLALPRKRRSYFHEAALIGVAVCAVNLGEVLLTLTAACAVSLSMRHVILARMQAGKDGRPDTGAAGRATSTGGARA